jgi:hypothetical protein
MGLRQADAWVLDSWFAVDGDDVRVFFLQAPRASAGLVCSGHST